MGQKKKRKSRKPESKPVQPQPAADRDAGSADDIRRRNSRRRIIVYCTLLLIVLIVMGGYWLFVVTKVDRLTAECEAAKTRGDWATLELKARELAIWLPDDNKPWFYLALGAEEVGDEVKQLQYLEGMPHPETAPKLIQFEMADLQFRQNHVRRAEKSFQQLVERFPDDPEAHRRLNFYYAMTRQRNKLIAESRRAIAAGADVPQTYVFLVGADWITFTNGWQVNVQWAQQYPDDNEVYEVASAVHLISAGVDQSMETMDERIKEAMSKSADQIANLRKKYPQNREIVILDLMYNVHRANARRVGEILNDLTIDIEDDSRFWRIIGWFHSYREDWKQAEEAYLKCLEHNPYDWQARHEYSTVLRHLKKNKELVAMQDSAAIGKEIMRRVLQAENTVTIPRATLELIIKYARACGENDVADRLEKKIN